MNTQKGLLAFAGIIILALTIFGTYFYTKSSLQSAPEQASTTTSTSDQTQTTTGTTPVAVETAPWRGQVRAQFNGLGNWKEEVVSDWRFAGTLDRSLLTKYPTGRITILTQTFNADDFGGDPNMALAQAGAKEDALIAAVRKTLTANGWTLTASPAEGGFYLDYLYVKNGHPLVLSTGSRNAVEGGMYVAVQYLE